MKAFIIIALCCLVELRSLADLDTKLVREIKSWQKGDAPPARLLKFPDGKIDMVGECGLRVWGSAVDDYVSGIQNADLLVALIFDLRAQSDTFHAAVSRLITLKGVGHAAHLLAERRKTEPSAFTRSELAVLSQLLQSPYIAVQVACIASEDMQSDNAENALQAMKTDLLAGVLWADAYRKHSDLHPDMRDRAKDPNSTRTLIGYLYGSTVSPTGFDIVTYRTAENVPLTHLRELFQAKRGSHILKAADGVYLYHIQSYYNGPDWLRENGGAIRSAGATTNQPRATPWVNEPK